MVETPQYNPPVDLRVSGNSNDTSKYQNQHVDFRSIFEILIVQVFSHSVKIVQPKLVENVETPRYNPLVDLRVSENSNITSKYQNQHVVFL